MRGFFPGIILLARGSQNECAPRNCVQSTHKSPRIPPLLALDFLVLSCSVFPASPLLAGTSPASSGKRRGKKQKQKNSHLEPLWFLFRVQFPASGARTIYSREAPPGLSSPKHALAENAPIQAFPIMSDRNSKLAPKHDLDTDIVRRQQGKETEQL